MIAATNAGLLIDLDVAAAKGAGADSQPAFDSAFPFVSALWSPEGSILLGLAGTGVLWRMGAARWSAAPMAFLILVPFEVMLKLGAALAIVVAPLLERQLRRQHPATSS